MVEQDVRCLPAGVQAHVTRLRMTGPHHVALAELLPRIEEAARMLMDATCDVVVFHCTAASTEAGLPGEERALAAVARSGAPQATTTATAIRRTLAAVGARRIVLVTPYDTRATEAEAAFLRSAGYDVLQAHGFDLGGSDQYCAAPPQFWLDRTLEASRPEADTYLVSCANIATFPVIAELERRLDRAVVTSNQAVLWDALIRLGWRDRGACPASLFDHRAAPSRSAGSATGSESASQAGRAAQAAPLAPPPPRAGERSDSERSAAERTPRTKCPAAGEGAPRRV
jgi:maleate isomerase